MINKRILFAVLVVFLISGSFPKKSFAAEQNYFTYVVPVRPISQWRSSNNISTLAHQREQLDEFNIPTTWLLQEETLTDKPILDLIKNDNKKDELGIFLEVSQGWANRAQVKYSLSGNERWEKANKLFLSGYSQQDRKRLIDTAFAEYKKVFGKYPKSVGAWHVDNWSLMYMRDSYQIEAVLGLADQYTTDGYQEWGQYIGEPYYPSQKSVIEPAINAADKIDIVKLQWAPREPLLSYGKEPRFSNYSAQVNDYYRFYGLGKDYLEKFIKTYTDGVQARISQITFGIETGELEPKFEQGLLDQLQVLKDSKIQILTMSDFANAYKKAYPDVSPSLRIESRDATRAITWFMSPSFRAGFLKGDDGKTKIVDLRFYHGNGYFDNEYMSADTHENLSRIVPAVIDQIGLGNSLDIGDSDYHLTDNQIVLKTKLTNDLFKDWNVVVESKDNETILSPVSTSYQPDKKRFYNSAFAIISLRDWLKIKLGNLVPDIRYSIINHRPVLGVMNGDELWGIDLNNLKVGKLKYGLLNLDAFLRINKWKGISIPVFARQEDEVQRHSNLGVIEAKSANYGVGNLSAELGGAKKYENGYYFIR